MTESHLPNSVRVDHMAKRHCGFAGSGMNSDKAASQLPLLNPDFVR